MAEEIREAIYFPILWAVHLYLESRNDEVAYAMFQGPITYRGVIWRGYDPG